MYGAASAIRRRCNLLGDSIALLRVLIRPKFRNSIRIDFRGQVNGGSGRRFPLSSLEIRTCRYRTVHRQVCLWSARSTIPSPGGPFWCFSGQNWSRQMQSPGKGEIAFVIVCVVAVVAACGFALAIMLR